MTFDFEKFKQTVIEIKAFLAEKFEIPIEAVEESFQINSNMVDKYYIAKKPWRWLSHHPHPDDFVGGRFETEIIISFKMIRYNEKWIKNES